MTTYKPFLQLKGRWNCQCITKIAWFNFSRIRLFSKRCQDTTALFYYIGDSIAALSFKEGNSKLTFYLRNIVCAYYAMNVDINTKICQSKIFCRKRHVIMKVVESAYIWLKVELFERGVVLIHVTVKLTSF